MREVLKFPLLYMLCVCLFPFTVKASPDTEPNNKCNARVQASDGMLRKFFCMKYFCRHVTDNHSRILQASSCAKECQLNREKPREVKDNSYELSKNQR